MPVVIAPAAPHPEGVLAAALRRFIDNNEDAPKYLREAAEAWLTTQIEVT